MEIMTLPEAYKILGLTFAGTLTVGEVSRAYRRRAAECHPDCVAVCDKKRAEEEFKLLVRAKSVVDLLLSRAGRAGGVGVNPFRGVVRETAVPESKFVADLREAFKSIDHRVFKVHGSGMQESGWPDLQIYGRGWTGHLEAKSEDGTVSKAQQLVIEDLMRLGTRAWVIRLRDGEVLLEDGGGRVCAKIGRELWREREKRGGLLLEMLCGMRGVG